MSKQNEDREDFSPSKIESPAKHYKKYRRTKLVIERCACGNILSPHEIEIDLGDGKEETICDSCLYGTGAS